MMRTHTRIPADFPVRPVRNRDKAQQPTTCGHCGLTWDDAIATGYTPAPSARCPFEAFHIYGGERKRMAKAVTFTKQQRHMASMVRAILQGKWTNEAPDWADKYSYINDVDAPQPETNYTRAVQTAEAFIMVALADDGPFNEQAFRKLCGFRS